MNDCSPWKRYSPLEPAIIVIDAGDNTLSGRDNRPLVL